MPGQGSLFGNADAAGVKPARPDELEVLITVKAAPNPSEKAGETVCVAGLALLKGEPAPAGFGFIRSIFASWRRT